MKPNSIALLLLALALPAGGCGKHEPAPGASRIVIRFLDAPEPGGGWEEVIARFEAAHPHIDVERIEGPSATDARENQYSTAFLGGDSPYDLVWMDVIWVPKFAAQGWLLPLDGRLSPAELEELLPGDVRGSIYDGKLYRIPIRSDAGMLYFRTDLVSSPPETFDDLVARARAAHSPPERWGFVFQGLQYEGLVCSFLEVLWGHGGDVLDERGEVVLDRPEGVRALSWMVGLVKDLVPEGVTTYKEEETRRLFQEGRAVFLRNWPYVWNKVQEDGSSIRGRVGIAPMVHAPGHASAAVLGGWGFGVSKQSKNPEAAWEFIRFVARPEQQKVLHFRLGAIPTRKALFRDPEVLAGSPHYPQLYAVLLRARPRPVHPAYAEISDALQVHVSAALVGRESPEEALRAAAVEVRRILGR